MQISIQLSIVVDDGVTSKYPVLLTKGKAPMDMRAKKKRRRTPEGSALIMMIMMIMMIMIMMMIVMMIVMMMVMKIGNIC